MTILANVQGSLAIVESDTGATIWILAANTDGFALDRTHNEVIVGERLDKCGSVLRAVFELMRDELHIEPATLVEKLAAVVREKAERAQEPCGKCDRPLGGKTKCLYCGTERKAESIFDRL